MSEDFAQFVHLQYQIRLLKVMCLGTRIKIVKKKKPVFLRISLLPLVGHKDSSALKYTPLVEPVLICQVVCDAQTNRVKACSRMIKI